MMHDTSFERTLPPRPRLLFGEPAVGIGISDAGIEISTERLALERLISDTGTEIAERLSSDEFFLSDRADREASDRTDMQLGAPPGVSHKKPDAYRSSSASMWEKGSSKRLAVDDLYQQLGPSGPCKKQLQRPELWMADPGKNFSFEDAFEDDECSPTNVELEECLFSAEKTRVNGRQSLGETLGSMNSFETQGREACDEGSLNVRSLTFALESPGLCERPARLEIEDLSCRASELFMGAHAPGFDQRQTFDQRQPAGGPPRTPMGKMGAPEARTSRASERFMGEHSPTLRAGARSDVFEGLQTPTSRGVTPRSSPGGLDRSMPSPGRLVWFTSPTSPVKDASVSPVLRRNRERPTAATTDPKPSGVMDETKDQNEDEDENNISTLGDLIHEPCAPCTPMARIVTPQRASMPDLYQGGWGSSPPSLSPSTKDCARIGRERQNSLMCRKDYTSLIFKRTPSQLLYDQHYTLTELLGRGDFGEVWAAIHHRTKEKYALKKSRRRFRGHKDRFKYLREIQNVAQLGHHPNLVHYERAWQDDGHFFLVMELCTGGTLQKLIQGLQGPMVLEDTRNYAKGLLRGLARLHAQSLLHLDLKPDNLFLMPDGGVKIGDFGLCLPATEWDEEEGDREYLAPEILENVASPAADIFSAGLVMYQMLYGVKRLPGNGPEWTAIRSGAPLPPPPAPAGHASASRPAQAFADLVQSMLRISPADRPSAETLLATPLAWADEPPANEELDGSKSSGKKRFFNLFKGGGARRFSFPRV